MTISSTAAPERTRPGADDAVPRGFAARVPPDRPPASTWWPDHGPRPPALPGEPYQPALFDQEPRRQPPSPTGPRVGRGGRLRISRIAGLPDRALPDVRRWSVTFGVAVLEALAGHRTIAQLVRYVSEDVQAAVQLAAGSTPCGTRERITVSSARIQVLSPRSVESCLHTLHGERHVLVAFRLVAAGDKWLCTELDVLAGMVRIRSASR